MIRKLIESDRPKILEYLYRDGSLNIFIIGDIEHFGFDKEFQTLYGEFDKDNNYLSVLLFYRENSVFYSHLDLFNEGWLEIMNKHDFAFFSGRKQIVDLIKGSLSGFIAKEMYFAEANSLKNDKEHDYSNIKKAESKADCEKLYDILSQVPEFGTSRQSKEHFVEGKLNSLMMGPTYFIEENDIIISTVATTAETSKSAMVVAVATREHARNRGLATKLMVYLMKEYFNEKKKYLCLFYDNPDAGKIYKRLGFEDIDKWLMLSKE